MITIINYGLGNIRAFVNVYERLNIKIKIAEKACDLKSASKIILPGVGAFDYAMNKLNESGMRDELEKLVIEYKIPVLGICVGMQIMASSSEEGKQSGLCWIDGHVKLFDTTLIPYQTKLPHMGWNDMKSVIGNRLTSDLGSDPRFYFLHSYHFVCNNESDIVATTQYGTTYPSVINRDNIYGIQFHPEKSHANGIKVLSNFANL